MMEGEQKISEEIQLICTSKDAIEQDTRRIWQNWEDNYCRKRKENLLALKKATNKMEAYKAIKEAQFESLVSFKKELKDQTWRLISHNVIKAEQQKIWENSDEYERRQMIQKYAE